MNQRHCCLCGGKVVNGICIECGMHNGKSESDYKLNQSSCDKKPMTHVHYESSTSTWESREAKQKKQGTAQKPKSRKKIWTIIIIVLALINLIPSFLSYIIGKVSYELEDLDIFSGIEEEYEYDPYEYLEKELPETGVYYQTVLTAGNYIVGVDLPEGNYRASAQKNQGNIYVEDYDSGIYLGEYLGDGTYAEDTIEMDDIRLFHGAKLSISGGLEVELTSENAQVSEMLAAQANPVTAVTDLSAGLYTAGVDFPAGTYDLVAVEGYGSVDLKYIDEDGEEYYQECYYMDADPNQQYDSVMIKYVVIPEGYLLDIDELSIELRPSDRIISEDYESYYE